MTTQKTKLPEGWREVELGEICEIYQPKTISMKNLDKNGKYLVYGANGVIGKFNQYNHEEEEVLITCRGATCGKINISQPFSWITGNAMVITPKENLKKYINKKFLFYLLRNFQIKKIISGSAQPQITRTPLIRFRIYFPFTPDGKPDLETQKKIVAILEKAEKLKEKREQAIKLADEYLKSVFAEMFGNGKKFEEKEIQEICNTFSGGTPSRMKKEYWENGKIPWIKSGDLNKDKITEANEFITELGLKESSAKYIEPETVLIAMYGATAGKTSISKIKATTNQAVCAIIPKDYKLNKIYLLYWLRSKYKYIVSLSFGGGQPNISQQIIRSLKIPLPPIELQQKFASIVEKVEKMKEKQLESKKKIEEMFNSLMQKAFRGELVK